MRRYTWIGVFAVGLVFVSFAVRGDQLPALSYPQITSADADAAGTTLFIGGRSFGVGATPVVLLGGMQLKVDSFAPTAIVAELPPGLPAGSYSLWLQSFPGASISFGLWTFMAATIGAVGPKGPKGDTGAQGLKGDTGSKGDKGDPGPTGEPGIPGAQGITGPQGTQGAAGPVGPKGDAGSKGDAGPAGVAGPPGPAGPPSAGGPPPTTFAGQYALFIDGAFAGPVHSIGRCTEHDGLPSPLDLPTPPPCEFTIGMGIQSKLIDFLNDNFQRTPNKRVRSIEFVRVENSGQGFQASSKIVLTWPVVIAVSIPSLGPAAGASAYVQIDVNAASVLLQPSGSVQLGDMTDRPIIPQTLTVELGTLPVPRPDSIGEFALKLDYAFDTDPQGEREFVPTRHAILTELAFGTPVPASQNIHDLRWVRGPDVIIAFGDGTGALSVTLGNVGQGQFEFYERMDGRTWMLHSRYLNIIDVSANFAPVFALSP